MPLALVLALASTLALVILVIPVMENFAHPSTHANSLVVEIAVLMPCAHTLLLDVPVALVCLGTLEMVSTAQRLTTATSTRADAITRRIVNISALLKVCALAWRDTLAQARSALPSTTARQQALGPAIQARPTAHLLDLLPMTASVNSTTQVMVITVKRSTIASLAPKRNATAMRTVFPNLAATIAHATPVSLAMAKCVPKLIHALELVKMTVMQMLFALMLDQVFILVSARRVIAVMERNLAL